MSEESKKSPKSSIKDAKSNKLDNNEQAEKRHASKSLAGEELTS